jgi:hypothetical protein
MDFMELTAHQKYKLSGLLMMAITAALQWSNFGFFYLLNYLIPYKPALTLGLTVSILFSLYALFRTASKAEALSKHKYDTNQAIMLSCLIIFNILLIYAFYYSSYSIKDPDGIPTQDFKDCLYFSIVTFTTLGYGDFLPSSEVRLVAATQSIVGYLCLGMITSMFFLIVRRGQQQFEQSIEKKINEQKVIKQFKTKKKRGKK